MTGSKRTAFERGSPPLTAATEEVVAFWSTYQRALLAQSMSFVLSAGAYLWFYGSLRSVLMRAEGGTGTLATIAFGAGIISASLQIVLQCFQAADAIAARCSSRLVDRQAALLRVRLDGEMFEGARLEIDSARAC